MTANTSTIEVVRPVRLRDAKGRFVKAMPILAVTAVVDQPVEVLAKISDHDAALFETMNKMVVGQTIQVFSRNTDGSVCKAFGIVHRITETNKKMNFPELVVGLFNSNGWHHECDNVDCHMYEVIDDISDYQEIPFSKIYQIIVQRNQKGNFWQIRLAY